MPLWIWQVDKPRIPLDIQWSLGGKARMSLTRDCLELWAKELEEVINDLDHLDDVVADLDHVVGACEEKLLGELPTGIAAVCLDLLAHLDKG